MSLTDAFIIYNEQKHDDSTRARGWLTPVNASVGGLLTVGCLAVVLAMDSPSIKPVPSTESESQPVEMIKIPVETVKPDASPAP